MRTKLKTIAILFLLLLTISSCKKSHPVYMGKEMSSGYDLGLVSGKDSIGWLEDMGGYMKMAYPAEQNWGSLYITVGKIKDLPNKPTVDLSSFKKLCFELKGDTEIKMEVGMKDAQDPDDGTETRVPVNIEKDWKSYEIDLSEFKTADMKQIYVLAEFVFTGDIAQTAYFRNIQFK